MSTDEPSSIQRLLESEDAVLAEQSYPEGYSVLAAALDEPQPADIAAAAKVKVDADDGWLVELARADAAGEAAVDARAFLDAAEGDSDDSGCWSSDAGGSEEGGADDEEWFDPTSRVQHGIDLGSRRNLEHLGDWHAYNEMTTALQGLIRAAAKGPRPPSPEAAERARSPEAKPLEPRVINRRDPKEAGKGIFYPRPRETWGAPRTSWRPDAPWDRNMRQLDGSLVAPRDVDELGERLVSAAQDWAAIQKMEQKGRGQLAGITDVLSSVRQCLEFIHGGSLGVEELKPYFERMLRHVQHLCWYTRNLPLLVITKSFLTECDYRRGDGSERHPQNARRRSTAGAALPRRRRPEVPLEATCAVAFCRQRVGEAIASMQARTPADV